MIRILYAYSNGEPCDIAGTPAELRQIKKSILDLVEAGQGSVRIIADSQDDPKPYDKSLSELSILIGEGPTRVTLGDGGVLSVIGSAECLEGLASFFEFPDDTDSLNHCHYEYYEGNKWIDSKSLPLVIGIK